MKQKFKQIILSASLLTCGLGISGYAQAEAYAVATNNIQNSAVNALVGGIPFPISTCAGCFTFGTPSSESSTSATLNGSGVAFSATGPNPDSPISAVGSAAGRANELGALPYYTLIGPGASSYSYGDARIVTEQDAIGTPIVARNVAETNVATNGSANADGTNKSSTAVTVNVVTGTECDVNVLCQISFSGQSDPYIRALLTANANPGSIARGTLAFTITLTALNAVIPTFSWAPNGDCVGGAGNCDGIFGGTELLDDENLNLSREALFAGQDSEYSGAYGAGNFGNFSAITNRLLSGSYTLSIFMNEKTDATLRVSEPGSLALLGLGLLGLGLRSRRKPV